MDFEFYRNFITVAETGNLTTASKKLALAQPALSAQIKTLEHYYGAKLIQTARGKRQLTLTEAGEAFLGKARQICRTEETILLDMQSFNKKASGTLRFSVSPAKSTFFINTYLRPFAAAYPEICFQFREEAVSAQTRHIAENSSDFAFANAPLPSPQLFAAHKTQKEYFYAVYSPQANCGLDPQQPLTPKQLQNIPVCCNFGCYSLLRKPASSTASCPRSALSLPPILPHSLSCRTAAASPSFPPAAGTTSPKGCCSSSWLMMNCILSRRCSGPKKTG